MSFSGNALGIIGVTTGLAATLGHIKPDPLLLTQMGACVGTGEYLCSTP